MPTGNETNAGQTWGAPIHIWVFSYLPCDRRDRVIFITARRNYYPAVWEFATAREPKHYNLPFRNFLRISKPRSWTGDPEHVKYRSISLGPLAHAGLEAPLIVLDSKSAVCMAKNGKDTKHTIHIARRMHFGRNGEKCKMHKIYWCEVGLQLAEIGTKNVSEPDLTPRMKYVMVRLENWEYK